MSSASVPESIRVLLDSCRDESELDQPEMQPLRIWLSESAQHRAAWEDARRWNRRVHSALHDVSLPNHLRQKIRDALSNAPTEPGNAAPVEQFDLTAPSSLLSAGRVERSHERKGSPQVSHSRNAWRIIGAASLATSALVMVVLSWNWFQKANPTNPSARELCLASLAWIQQADSSPWPADLATGSEDQPFVPKQVCRKLIHTGFGPTDCYLATTASGRRIFQFVFRVNRTFGLPNRLPSRPDLPLNGYACSAYQLGNQVYVVAVQGNAADYQKALENGLPVTTLMRQHGNQPLDHLVPLAKGDIRG